MNKIKVDLRTVVLRSRACFRGLHSECYKVSLSDGGAIYRCDCKCHRRKKKSKKRG